MKKIMQLSAHGGFGGGERVMLDIVNGLKSQFEFIIVAPAGKFVHELNESNVETEMIKAGTFSAIRDVRKLVRSQKPDILHCHGTRAAIWGRTAVIGLRHRPKVIYTVHGFHIANRPWLIKNIFYILEVFLNLWCDQIICVSEGDRETIKISGTASTKEIPVIYNGIQLERFSDIITSLENGKLKILSVARLHQPKDYKTLLLAVDELLKRGYAIKLKIVGDGPQKNEIVDLVKNLGIQKSVEFLGSRNDIPNFMQWSDVVVLSTNWEGLPLVPLEAGASKRPVVASRVTGVTEVIIENETGLLFEAQNVEDLVSCFIRLFDPVERARLAENGYQHVRNNFDVKMMTTKYLELYRTI